ncbi:hypothetical protein DSM106972_035750 [Dulcicalothrix desertica PCC 7102]|uniref:Nucleotide-diphospho-sugar transferase domain-containing protein n=1 Tax=Dulcicalothrix desertica PCC 7102 TaxID=232991 RepID=A0A433VHJ7_9CYAN|nr:hypothetical protein [Dulcicalothrix desertica]RUT05568.1 hypothetical protein DSM106972_035750 [Dulcicalothrix desertica PCC 7102]TWH54664.1 hypothetical protein CAL7102_02715 [Dulcicalothrix desertica PCC 7102]
MQKLFCFCTLAISRPYNLLAQDLAKDLEKYSPGTLLIVYTDLPHYFKEHSNVIACRHSQKGVRCCWNDKRFAIKKALSMFDSAICIDADTRIIGYVPEDMEFLPGITVYEHLHILDFFKNKEKKASNTLNRLSNKMNLSIKDVRWVQENLFVITKDEGKETEFIEQWDKVARYLDFRGVYGDGNSIGFAAAKAGWSIQEGRLNKLLAVRQHSYISRSLKKSILKRLKNVLAFSYRFNKELLVTLNDFKFYY